MIKIFYYFCEGKREDKQDEIDRINRKNGISVCNSVIRLLLL